MIELPHTHSCFVCGESNPIGLKLRFHTDGQKVETRFTPAPEHNGFKQVVHGGLIATLLDETMVWACAVQTRRFAFCAEFNIRFHNPTQPNRQTIATGELVANRRDKIFETKAELRDAAGLLLASATGKYLPIEPALADKMGADLVGGVEWLATTRPHD